MAGGVPLARGSGAAGRSEDTCGPGDRSEGGSSPSGPRPSTSSRIDSTGPGIRRGDVRCTACRCDEPARRTGPRARGDPPPIPVPRGRKGRRPAGERYAPSPRSDDPGGRSASGLRLLAYRAIDGNSTDHGPAPNAVLAGRGRRHRTHRAGRRRGEDRVARWRVHPRWTGRNRTPGRWRWRGSSADARRRGRGSRRRSRGRDSGGGLDLGKRIAALRAKERPFARHLAAMQADRHGRGQG